MHTDIEAIITASDTINIAPRLSAESSLNIKFAGPYGTVELSFTPDKAAEVVEKIGESLTRFPKPTRTVTPLVSGGAA